MSVRGVVSSAGWPTDHGPSEVDSSDPAEAGPLAALPTVARNLTGAFKGLLHAPLGRGAGPLDASERDLCVRPETRQKLLAGDLRGFWGDRVGNDPVARVGLALWGTEDDLRSSIAREGLGYWTPDINALSGLGLAVRADLPPDFPLPPKTEAEVLTYWKWMGEVTRQRVIDQATSCGVLSAAATEPERGAFLRKIGVDLATAHAAAVDADMVSGSGDVPGLLSARQVAAYHHAVFASHGLPPETYGGTPFRALPDALELRMAGGLYAHDADPHG